jgi:hypothetical protein
MRKISTKVAAQINADQGYKVCMLKAHAGHVCGGRLTREHALIYANKQVDAKFAIISCCARGQEVDQYQDAHTMDKNLNVWVALNRATDEELHGISKVINYFRLRDQLNQIYGEYIAPTPVPVEDVINYPF